MNIESNELTGCELAAVSGGDIRSTLIKAGSHVATTRVAPPKPDPGGSDPDGNAFWAGFIIGLIF